jgi:hypothetical protein
MKKNWLVIILGVFVCGMFLFGWVYTSLSADDFYVIPTGNRNVKAGTTNTAVGVNALKANTTGAYNTASGADALEANTAGGYNTASGAGALETNTTGSNNTASGTGALQENTTGNDNTASGNSALVANTTACENTAVGQGALQTQSFDNNNTTYKTDNTAVGFHALFANQPTSTSTGILNTALGSIALSSNTTGFCNTAVGAAALLFNTNGSNNTAIGNCALYSNTGNKNTALGYDAGDYSLGSSGSNNIYIGFSCTPYSADESDTIRIGNNYDAPQTQTFIEGIANSNYTGSGNAVYVTGDGELFITTSSRRYKEDIQDMGKASSGLMKLRPVTFYYKPQYTHGKRTLQYGLIAEEVAKVYPNLVQYDKNGKPQTVYYHLINAMLLNEVQKQHRQLQAETKELKTLRPQLQAETQELKTMRPQLQAETQELKTLHATVAAVQQQQRLSAAQNRKLLARLAQLESQFKKMATASKPAGLRPVVEAAAVSAIP